MANRKGKPRAGGRKKGTPNKLTAGVKEALHLAFEGAGGVPALITWAKKHRTSFYLLWVKTLPREVKAEHSGPNGGPIETKAADHEHRNSLTAADLDAVERLVAEAAGRGIPADGGPEQVHPPDPAPPAEAAPARG